MPFLISFLHYKLSTSKLIVFTLILAAQSGGLILRIIINHKLFQLRLVYILTPAILASAFGSLVITTSLP